VAALGDASLMKCTCAESGRPVVQLHHDPIQSELLNLNSDVAEEVVQNYLQDAFAQSEKQDPSQVKSVLLAKTAVVSLTGAVIDDQGPCSEDMGVAKNGGGYRGCQASTIHGKECQKWNSQFPHKHKVTNDSSLGIGDHAFCRNPNGEKDTIWCYTNDPDVEWQYCQPKKEKKPPGGKTKSSCVVSADCKVSPASCGKMRNGFLNVIGDIADKKEQLTEDISDAEKSCKKIAEDYSVVLNTETAKLQTAQSDLAAATKQVVESNQRKEQASTSYKELMEEFEKEKQKCCDNKNDYQQKICGLKKIRGQLYMSAGVKAEMKDCEVADWTDGECSKSCAGGTQQRKRDIIEYPVNGTQCPPLKMERPCNTHECPVDCEVSVWTEWSDCTAECGGGVRSRMRPKTQEPAFGGKPCPQTTETQLCNPQSCGADCELGDWAAWSSCSKKCNTGHRSRRMPVKVPERGTGTCPSVESEQRLGFEECNKKACMTLLPSNRTVLQCKSKLDVVILMDGGGAVTKTGFDQAKSMFEKLFPGIGGKGSKVKLAMMVFGGPTNAGALEKCTGSDPNNKPDLEKDCGMKWVSHLSNDTAAVATALKPIVYPESTTMASMAIAEAQSELAAGRPDAASVVVVVTRAKTMSGRKAAKASEDLKKTARLIWVTIGPTEVLDMREVKVMASKPWEDNVVEVKDFNLLPTPATLNTIIASMCPEVA